MKKILVVSHARDNRDAGSSRVVHLIKEAITSDIIKVDLIHSELDPAEFRTKTLGRLALPRIISGLAENAEDYNVVIGCNGMLYPLFEKLKARSRTPLLIDYVHGLSTFDRIATIAEGEFGRNIFSWHYRLITGPLTRRLPEKWEARGASLADAVVVHNSRDREFLQRRGISNISQVALPLIPEIAEAARRASPCGRDPKKLLWFGSWTDRKGVNYLPDAFAQILEQVPDVILTIGGTDRDLSQILTYFPASVRPNVRVLDRLSIQQQIEEYASHAIFLFPSLSEGFGFALLEAMSMGMAAVATMTGFAADHLTPGEHFVAVPMSSSAGLAAGVIRLTLDEAKRVKMATAGRELAMQFTLERYGQQVLQIIRAAESRRH